jgi:hypothetical protein
MSHPSTLMFSPSPQPSPVEGEGAVSRATRAALLVLRGLLLGEGEPV